MAQAQAQRQSAPVVSRPVVQGLPSGDSQRLSAALARIGRNPQDFSALIDAGDAANAMGDPEAAIGFYKRADSISPYNPRTKAGLARALVLQGKPTEAIPLFAGAEAGGAVADVTSDRGLAYDLVGDPVTAQRYYQTALARGDNDEVRRRLGISLAITGDAAGSDAMLMPLLRKQDKPAWRAHAFALAIAGKTKEAVDTVNAILPPTLAQSVTPYLRYMPRLTRAQQAAAGNLGKFPRASEIGRDDPAIAAYTPTATTRVASADARLIPRGKPMGGRSRSGTDAAATVATPAPLSSSERRTRDRAARLARVEAASAGRVAPPDPTPTIGRDDGGELPALGASTPMAPAAAMAAAAMPRIAPFDTRSTPTLATRETPAPTRDASVTMVPQTEVAARSGGPAVVRTGSLTLPSVAPAQPRATLAAAPGETSAPPAVPRIVLPQASLATPPRRTFDLATLNTSSRPASASAATAPAALTTPAASAVNSAPVALETAASAQSGEAISLEQAFAGLGSPSRAPAPIAGAVDVRAIEPTPPAQVAELAKAEPAKSEPSRSAARVETAKALPKKGEPTKTAEQDTPTAVGKKKGATSKDGKLAEAKLADAKLSDAKLADGKKADPKKTDAKAVDAKKADAKKADLKKPSHPSRIWVQVGVGRDKAAIGYDWRKFAKDNPALFKGRQPYTSDMGRTNRILAGPFETQKAAVDLLGKLKKADIGGVFVWTSPAGQVVDPLTVK